MARTACLLATIIAASILAAADKGFEINGRIDPPRARALVVLDGATSPFTSSTFTDSGGRFRFRELAAGPYILRVFVPGMDELEQSVEVGPSLADGNRRISLTVPFAGTATSRQAREAPHKVDVRALSIPDPAKRDYREAQALLSKDDVDGAIKRLEHAVEIAPRFTEAWNNLGTIAYHARRFADAERYFRRALEHDPGAYPPALNLGGVLLNLGRYLEALGYNMYAVHERPQETLANSQLGMNYLFLDRLDLALKYLKEAKRLDPGHFTYPQVYLAEIYSKQHDRKAAISELEDFLKRHPDAAEAGKVRAELSRLRAE
jgi:tetratricopeptide (TPR) repeat protein